MTLDINFLQSNSIKHVIPAMDRWDAVRSAAWFALVVIVRKVFFVSFLSFL